MWTLESDNIVKLVSVDDQLHWTQQITEIKLEYHEKSHYLNRCLMNSTFAQLLETVQKPIGSFFSFLFLNAINWKSIVFSLSHVTSHTIFCNSFSFQSKFTIRHTLINWLLISVSEIVCVFYPILVILLYKSHTKRMKSTAKARFRLKPQFSENV